MTNYELGFVSDAERESFSQRKKPKYVLSEYERFGASIKRQENDDLSCSNFTDIPQGVESKKSDLRMEIKNFGTMQGKKVLGKDCDYPDRTCAQCFAKSLKEEAHFCIGHEPYRKALVAEREIKEMHNLRPGR